MASSQLWCILWVVLSLAALSSVVFAQANSNFTLIDAQPESSKPLEELTAYDQADSNFSRIDPQPDFPCTNNDNFTDFQIDLIGDVQTSGEIYENVLVPVLRYLFDSTGNLTDITEAYNVTFSSFTGCSQVGQLLSLVLPKQKACNHFVGCSCIRMVRSMLSDLWHHSTLT